MFRFAHNNLNVLDLERSMKFYEEALGLKVSQYEGLMGDTPVSPEKQAEDAHFARRHVEKLPEQFRRRQEGVGR